MLKIGFPTKHTVGLAVLAFAAMLSLAQDIPAGTLLPVQLKRDIEAGKSPAGQHFSATLMQDVVLGEGKKLPRGATVEGRILESVQRSAGAPTRLVLTFERVRSNGRATDLRASLRALASMFAVHDAELPTNLVDDFGSTFRDWNTTQVGGQGVYRGDGIVMRGPDVVAKSSSIGEVTGKALSLSPRSPCVRDEVADRDQSFWVFSTDACGPYGFRDANGMETLTLVHAGRTEPIGNIILESRGKLELRGGSGWLLVVLAPDTASTHKSP